MPFRLPDLFRREPRRAARALGNRLSDAQQGGREIAHWVQARLPVLETRRPEPAAVLWPTIAAAAGAGAAFWWWTSWSRGRAEAAERAELDRTGGEAGAAHPETIMAHSPPPDAAPVVTPDPSAAGLSVPAEQVMAHAPPPAPLAPDGEDAPKLAEMQPVVAPSTAAVLESSLAVQADAEAPPTPGRTRTR